MKSTEMNSVKMNKGRAIIIFIFAAFFASVININTQAAEMNAQIDTPAAPAAISEHSIAWDFYTYAGPDFTAEKTAFFPAQTVYALEEREDGWARISTYQGKSWVYLSENKIYTEKPLSLYDKKENGSAAEEAAVGDLLPQVVTVIERNGDWLLIETWLGEKWINLNAVRESVLLDVPAYNQRQLGYPTGCEIISVAMMLNYETPVDVSELIAKMPRSDDPNRGFRGEPTSEDGFSIFPPALVALAGEYVAGPEDLSGGSMEDLKEKLNANRPVAVWVNGLGFNVHAVCLSGYNKEGFFYNDPWTGKKDAFIAYDNFYRIWDKPIWDQLYGDSFPTRKALSRN